MSAAASIAIESGFSVSGCDLNIDTPYISSLKKQQIKIHSGNSRTHINKDTQLVVSPAALFDKQNEEVKSAKNVITWQKFLGEYIAQNKITICISGTHGKSTTTALVAEVLEEAGFDPTVMIGAKVNKWLKNYKVGKGNYLVLESDEFFDNFLNYSPDIIILTNIEFDHPDYFNDEKQLFESFKKYVGNLKGLKILIYNEEDNGIKKLFKIIRKDMKLIPYVKPKSKIKINLLGDHNQSNAQAVIKLSQVLKIDKKIVNKVFKNFKGIGRRMEVLHSNKVTIIDDYAHHPTAIKKTLKALRDKYPNNKIKAIIEPHSYSRTKATLSLYKDAFLDADEIYVTQIFKARDSEDFGVSSQDIISISKNKNIKGFDISKLQINDGDIVIVMGAGESYKIAKNLAEKYK